MLYRTANFNFKMLNWASITLVLCLGFVFGPAKPTFAASCSGTSCFGLNPETEGCSNDAIVKKYVGDDQVTLQIRYSSRCKAWWARVNTESPEPTGVIFANIIQFYNGQESNRQRIVGPHYVRADHDTSWTYMINDLGQGDKYDACYTAGFVTVLLSPDESNNVACTGRI